MGLRANIEPQWAKLARWYWDTLEDKTNNQSGMSIWDMLYNEYGAVQSPNTQGRRSVAVFPDEQSYMMFLLKWG